MTAKRGLNKYVKKKNASIFFVLWTFFTLFSLVLVCIFAFSQDYMLKRSYRENVASDVSRCGRLVQRELYEYEIRGGRDYGAFLYTRASSYDVGVFILRSDGTALFPDADVSYGKQVKKLIEKLEDGSASVAIYEYDGEYVYGSRMTYEGEAVYFYLYKSLDLSESIVADMRTRTFLLSAFVIVLAVAVAGSVSGFLTRPLSEMTEKARRLANGDFDVDFVGESYGSEITALAQTLNYAKDEISRADSLQKDLIANVSHDFKTPLTMIKAYASMIREISGDNPEKRNKHAEVIIDEADRLASLVSDVLDLSKLQSGIDEIKRAEFDLSSYLRGVMDKFGYLTETKGYTFETEIDDGVITFADEAKIGQAIYNLVGNAINYTGEDKRVIVRLKRENGYARFSVTDTGKGIPPEELPGIWDRYYRSRETHKRPVQGTGLGLSIVKTVLEKHGFAFGADSTEGSGSTFFVLFPCRN